LNCGSVPCARSATRLRSAFCRSERVLQHRQPLPSSVTSSVEARMSASSMPTLPNSLMMTAVPAPSGLARKRRTSVVLPAPRKPVAAGQGRAPARGALGPPPNGPGRGGEKKPDHPPPKNSVAKREPSPRPGPPPPPVFSGGGGGGGGAVPAESYQPLTPPPSP